MTYREDMSIPVDLSELGQVVTEHDFAYLVTISDDGGAHLVAVQPVVGEGTIRVADLGRRSMGNAEHRPMVTLAWPPRTAGGHSLIVDGRATPAGSEEERGVITIVPSRAVLHRAAPAPNPSADPAACGSDCVEVPLPEATR
jgi:hypothetical protein